MIVLEIFYEIDDRSIDLNTIKHKMQIPLFP